MKKKILSLIFALITAAVCALGLTACGGEPPAPGGPVDPNPPITDNDDKDKEDQAKKDFNAAVEKFQAFATSLQAKKFACDKSDENIVVCENILKINDVYYEKVGDTQYQYVLGNDNQYHKTVYDAEKNVDHFKQLDNALSRFGAIEWKTLSESKVLTGIYMGQSVTYHTNDGNHNMTFDDQTSQYHDIGKTTQLPQNVIDDTKAPVESDKLYDEQGNLNYALFGETCLDWLNKTNYYGNLISRGTDITLNKVDYFNVDKVNKSIEFGVYNTVTQSDGTKTKRHTTLITYYQEFAEKVLNGDFETADELTKYLDDNYSNYPFNSSSANAIHEISTFDEDITAQEKENLFIMAENILTRLHEVGYQGDSINNEGTKVTEYAGAKILSVRKGDDKGGAPAYDLKAGAYMCDFDFLVEINGEFKSVSVNLGYKVNGASQNVLKDSPNSWFIRTYDSKEINFCPYTENTAQYAFVLDDDAYLVR